MPTLREISLYVTGFLVLIMGYALTGNLFNDTRGSQLLVGDPPITLIANAVNPASVGLSCVGQAVLSNTGSKVSISVTKNSQITCTGTDLSNVTWAISPAPHFVESSKQIKRHSFQVGNENNPFFNTTSGTNLINIHLGFETDDDDTLANGPGNYEDIFVVTTTVPTSLNVDISTALLSFQSTTTWIRTPGIMTKSASITAGISLTVLILGSLLLISALILHIIQERDASKGEHYSTLT